MVHAPRRIWIARATWVEIASTGAAGGLVLLALLACKPNKTDDTTDAAPAATPTATPSATVASDPPDASLPPAASALPKPKPKASAGSGGSPTAGKPDVVDPTGSEMIRTPDGKMVPTDGTNCAGAYAGPVPTDFKCHKKCTSNDDCHAPNQCLPSNNTKVCKAP